MAGCIENGEPIWSAVGLINRHDGLVTVWREATYGGGGFNGFDRDERFIQSASYRAFSLTERDGTLRSSPVEIDFEYRYGDPASATPGFQIQDRKVVPVPCSGACPSPSVSQLGRRADDLVWRGRTLVMADVEKQKECAIDLSPFLPETAAKDSSPNIEAVFYPFDRVLYIVRSTTDRFELFGSVDCMAPRIIDAGVSIEGAFSSEEAGQKDFRILDVAPGADPWHPSILLDWTSPHDGIYRERAGVLDLSTGKSYLLPIHPPGPIGFWRGSEDEVILAVDSDVVGDVGNVKLILHAPKTGSQRVLKTNNVLK